MNNMSYLTCSWLSEVLAKYQHKRNKQKHYTVVHTYYAKAWHLTEKLAT